MTHAPALTRPPGPQLGPVELARLLRRRQMTELLERAARRSPEVAHFRLGFEHAYLVSTPELVRELFGPLGRVTAKGRGLEQARLLLGDGLLTSEGELHRRQRRLVQPAFHASRVAAYAEVMRAEAAALPERAGWVEGAVRDLAADMADLTLRIVGAGAVRHRPGRRLAGGGRRAGRAAGPLPAGGAARRSAAQPAAAAVHPPGCRRPSPSWTAWSAG